ncbi:MAG: hypothetical protein NZM06_11160 [Chloroherpetonaceae bacterium]|nr:hypothetical protein [Chloroherpetonaceae bacterium]MDW8438171.1 gas vesicle protein GvpH [Chloroherpetonaceae bacterium]
MNKNDEPTKLDGFFNALEKLAKLAESLEEAKELSQEGEISLGKNAKASYAFRVRTLADIRRERTQSDFKPFRKEANPSKAQATTATPKILEPETDVFIEGDEIIVYAQLAGVAESDIELEVHSDILELRAKGKGAFYRKEILLPAPAAPESLAKSCKNGILEARLKIQKT